MRQGSRVRSLILKAGRKSRRTFNRLMIGSSQVGDLAVFPASTFPWITRLEAGVATIQAELDAVMTELGDLPGVEEISPDHSRIARDRHWRSFFLHAYGYRSGPACAACPRTAELVDAIPNLETAFFSVLQPGAWLRPHRGVTKALITCHVPLIVPADSSGCWIRLEDRRYHWQVGRAFVFDDTRLHEVRNDTDQARVVLLIHVRRPLRFPGSLVGSTFMSAVRHSPFVKDGVRNQQAWERKFLAAHSWVRQSSAG
jgi:beta-hydroxylase